jgi:hypothetical protein
MILFFLFETFAHKTSDINLNGYITHNFYRKFKHRNAKRPSGGVALYYKETISDGITIVENRFDT